MFVRNELLFNNAFLNQLTPTPAEKEGIYSLMRSARAWLRQADYSSPADLVETYLRPFMLSQSLDLAQTGNGSDERAFFLVAPWDPSAYLGILYTAPRGENLDGFDPQGRLPKGCHWMIRAVETAHAAGLRWAVLTDGERWRLLNVNGLRRYEAYLEIDLLGLAQSAENEGDFEMAAYLFSTLFRLEGSFARDSETGRCGLDEFQARSMRASERAEHYLKQTVCDHLETPGGGDGIMAQLCLGLVKAVDPTGNRSFTEAERDRIYRDATYLLYRLLFILYTEARGLLPAENPHYQYLSLHQLIDEALFMRADPLLAAARPTYLWDQLAMLFNLIDIGDPGPAQIPAFDGGLFDDAERPYLRGCKIQNTYLAEALAQLAFQPGLKDSAALERIDYRDLSVRHLGSLYEGMIEYRLFIAEEELLARTEKNNRVHYLPAKGSSRQPNDELIPVGRVYFAQSPHERKATGTHYTAEDLVEKLVQQTALRLVDERWAAFETEFSALLCDLNTTAPTRISAMQSYIDNRLRTFVEEQILSLRVCDPAMGSGHFLVHTAHQLTNAIVHTLSRTAWENPEIDLSPIFWRRQVVEHCLYGVDINPMAVELAKLSLWLASMTPGRPLSFLDHRLKPGNSLLGVRFDEIVAALQESDLNRATNKSGIAEKLGQYSFKETSLATQAAEEAVRLLDSLVHRDTHTLIGVEAQKIDYRSAQERMEAYRRVGDFLTALKMGLKYKESDVHLVARALERGEEPTGEETRQLLSKTINLNTRFSAFHWELEFPDIFLSSNSYKMDIVIGNPPFLGGLKISSELGGEFLKYLKATYPPTGGTADLCAYFIRVSNRISNKDGYIGFVTTNTISQGDTRETGLAVLIRQGGVITCVDRFVKWGGDANVEVNLISIRNSPSGKLKSEYYIDGNKVPHISTKLNDLVEGTPIKLFQNSKKAFVGEYVRGIGFVIDNNRRDDLIRRDPNNAECLRPYINGQDINNSLDHSSDRWVIYFEEWPLDKALLYPDLLSILEEKVKPERLKLPPNSSDYIKLREKWWQFARFSLDMHKASSHLTRILIRSRVSELHMLAFVNKEWAYSEDTVIFAFDKYSYFSFLQSNIHEVWLRQQASTLRTDIRYSPTDCFQTFPFPPNPSSESLISTEEAGCNYYENRQVAMFNRRLGLTKTYNLFHHPDCHDSDVQTLRMLHAAMDRAVLACYGWEDIDLRHDFYHNDRKKIRFMPCCEARREIFTRLIALNQQIASEEAAHGQTSVVNNEDEGDLEEQS